MRESCFSENQLQLEQEVNVKQRPNHGRYIQTIRRMSPEKRLLKAFELSEFVKELFTHGLHKRFPDLEEEELARIRMERLRKCHNRNY